MNDLKKNKFFLLIGLKQITFAALNEFNKIILIKELLADSLSLEENFKVLQNFLDQNIFNIEKEINNHIKEIDLIINYEDFFTIDVSTVNDSNNYIEHPEKFSNFLVNIKNNVIKDTLGFDLIHMIISKFIIDEKEYFSIPKDNDCNNINFEIRFVCLKSNVSQSLKKILSKYEITIKNISSYTYVKNFIKSEVDNIFDISDKLRDGLNQKEVIFINKPPKNNGFFEKFFNFFS